MLKLVKKKIQNPISLKEHYLRRNHILIKRKYGGYGDILMQRMLFEDFQKTFPELKFHFFCPEPFSEMMSNHPFVTNITKLEEKDYGIIYDISTICRVHELKYGSKNTENRSDIWAAYCGIKLKNHNMFLNPKLETLKKCQFHLLTKNQYNQPTVLLSTKSVENEFGIAKSLTDSQISALVDNIRKLGLFPFVVHIERQAIYDHLGVDQFTNCSIQDWIGLVAMSNYVISIDTATFHIAGGLGKPLVGIFTFTNGKLYGKYYDFILVQKHRDNKDWDCGPCFNMLTCPKSKDLHKPCLTELSNDYIFEGLTKAIKKWPYAKTNQNKMATVLPVHKA